MERARTADTYSLKRVVVDWIIPDGEGLAPVFRPSNVGRGFEHEATGRLLCPAELDWQDEE